MQRAERLIVGQSTRMAVQTRIKRGIDVLLSVLLGAILAPLMLGIAVMIKLDAPGAVFYVHERVGRGGRKIRIYKFRTMVMDADRFLELYLRQHPSAQLEWTRRQKLCNDPRITRAGRSLRRFSLDELPQLLNVIRGDLSLVGPRPITECEVGRYGDVADLYGGIRPGVTGLWQVSGRSDTSYEERVRLDRYYVEHWSVQLDLWVLLRTLRAVWTRTGAY